VRWSQMRSYLGGRSETRDGSSIGAPAMLCFVCATSQLRAAARLLHHEVLPAHAGLPRSHHPVAVRFVFEGVGRVFVVHVLPDFLAAEMDELVQDRGFEHESNVAVRAAAAGEIPSDNH